MFVSMCVDSLDLILDVSSLNKFEFFLNISNNQAKGKSEHGYE